MNDLLRSVYKYLQLLEFLKTNHRNSNSCTNSLKAYCAANYDVFVQSKAQHRLIRRQSQRNMMIMSTSNLCTQFLGYSAGGWLSVFLIMINNIHIPNRDNTQVEDGATHLNQRLQHLLKCCTGAGRKHNPQCLLFHSGIVLNVKYWERAIFLTSRSAPYTVN